MGSKAVIDEDILGWGNDVQELKEKYSAVIPIGSIVELPPATRDAEIGGYCYENGCDLFTGDQTSYVEFFRDARIKSVIITNYGMYEKAKKLVYRVQIIQT